MQNSRTEGKRDPAADYDYEKSVNLSIQWTCWLLKPIGLWSNSRTTSRTRRRLDWLINLTCFALLAFYFIPSTLYVIFDVQELYAKLKQFGPLIFVTAATVKYYFLLVHKSNIRECVEQIKQDWRSVCYTEDREIMITNANFGRKLVMISTFFMYSGFVFYYIAVPISVGKITAENESLTFIPLVLPFTRRIIDTRQSPTNEIVFSIQMVVGALMHGITSAACSLAAAFAVHACGQMQVLTNWLNHLIDGRSDMNEQLDGRIASVVCQHVRILKFLALTQQTLQQISLAEFLGCMLNICLVGYYVIRESQSNDVTSAVTYSILLVSITFNIFIFCYIGEIVAEQSMKIGEASYMIEWYRMPGNKKLSCVMIIAMSNCSTKLMAGDMVELSVSTFTNVVKTAVAFLNVLRTMT